MSKITVCTAFSIPNPYNYQALQKNCLCQIPIPSIFVKTNNT